MDAYSIAWVYSLKILYSKTKKEKKSYEKESYGKFMKFYNQLNICYHGMKKYTFHYIYSIGGRITF